jgi:thioredoxin reductase (NADPH)
MKIYDLIIVGAGPAGISAGIYAKNFGLDCLIIGENVGGLINSAYRVENYPGIFNITGKELSDKFEEHRKHLDIFLKKERVENIKKEKIFEIKTDVD